MDADAEANIRAMKSTQNIGQDSKVSCCVLSGGVHVHRFFFGIENLGIVMATQGVECSEWDI